MNNIPQKKKNDELDIYGTISFVIMFIFISIIILLVLYYSGVLSAKKENKPFAYTEVNAQDVYISEDDTAPVGEVIEEEYDPNIERLKLFLPEVELITDTDIPPHYLEELYPDTILKETTDAGQEYIDNIVFLGDSTTHGMKSYQMLKDGKETNQVWTPVSGTLTLSQVNITTILFPDTDVEITIEEAIKLKKPPILIMTLGLNGVSFMGEDYFKGEYIKLIEMIKTISPDTIMILQSIFPIAESYRNQNQINNENISAANEWIAAVANETGIKFLNTYTALVVEDGFLPAAYQNGDGMHFNEIGFQIVLDYIRTHAYIIN